MHKYFYSLSFRLLVLVLSAALPILGLMLYTAYEQHELASAQVKTEALRVTRLAAKEQEELIVGARQLLTTLAHLPEVSGNSPECSERLADLLSHYPQYSNLGVVDEDGNVTCSAIPLTKPVNQSDFVWFKGAVQTRGFAIGEYQIGRISGVASLYSGYPIINEQGQVQAVVYAALDMGWLNRLAASAGLPEGSELILIDRNGTILAHYPEPEKWIGQTLPASPLIQTVLKETEGATEAVGLDNVKRLYSYIPLVDVPGAAYLSTGIPSQVAFAEVNRITARNLLGLGVITVVTIALVWLGGDLFILRRTRALLRATQQMAAGDLSARTGITQPRGELSQVAFAFDEMAAALQQREVERNRAEDALVTSKTYTESIIQNFLDTLIVVDAEAKIQTANPATCLLLGYTEEELKGQSVSMIFAEEEEEEEEVKHVFQFFKEPEKAETLRPQDTIRNCELTYKTKDGRLIPMLFNASILTDEMGNVTGVVAGAKDITEIKQAQETLRKTEERFSDVIENIFKFVPEGLLVLTDKLNVFRRNKALEDLVHQYAEKLNYSEEELADIINEQVKMRVVSGEKSDIRIPRYQK